MIKYSKAPISEVIIGVTFNTPIFQTENVIFELIAYFKEEFPSISVHAPLADEELKDFKLVNGIDSKITGPGLYRLRNQNFMVQLQLNKFYFNWIRGDNEMVGEYPGFNRLLNKFNELTEVMSSFLRKRNSNLEIFNGIKYLELHYQDRFYWQDYIGNLSYLDQIINLSIPVLNKENVPNNIFSNYTIPVKIINGHCKISINTTGSISQRQLIVLENNMKGKVEKNDFNNWFKKSHELQIDFFEQFINKKLLASWK